MEFRLSSLLYAAAILVMGIGLAAGVGLVTAHTGPALDHEVIPAPASPQHLNIDAFPTDPPTGRSTVQPIAIAVNDESSRWD